LVAIEFTGTDERALAARAFDGTSTLYAPDFISHKLRRIEIGFARHQYGHIGGGRTFAPAFQNTGRTVTR
jgi:hypothetical protein